MKKIRADSSFSQRQFNFQSLSQNWFSHGLITTFYEYAQTCLKGAGSYRGLPGMTFIEIWVWGIGIVNQPIKVEVKFYSVFSLLICLKLMRKTAAGIITKEITKTLNIIVQLIPTINPVTIWFSFFYAIT